MDSPARWCDQECDRHKRENRCASATGFRADLAALRRAPLQPPRHFCRRGSRAQILQKTPTTGIERIGIFLPSLVILLEQVEIQAVGEGRMHGINTMS